MTTEKRLQAMLNANQAQLAEIDKVLSGTNQEKSIDRIIRRKEVARLLSRSLRGVDLLREQHVLEPVTLPGRVRGCGFRLSDVISIIGGKAA